MLYITLSVAGVILVATVILTAFVCLACYQNRRVSKNAQLMRLAAQVSTFNLQVAPVTYTKYTCTHTHITHSNTTHTQQSSFRKTMSPVTTPTKLSYQSPKLHFQGGNSLPTVSLQKSAEDWELHPCQIVVENELGQGRFGDVYQGTIRGGVGIYKSNGPQIMRVAIKILRGIHLRIIHIHSVYIIDTLLSHTHTVWAMNL